MGTNCTPVNSSSYVAFPDTKVLVGNRAEGFTRYAILLFDVLEDYFGLLLPLVMGPNSIAVDFSLGAGLGAAHR